MQTFQCTAVLRGHTAAIHSIATLEYPHRHETRLPVVTVASDGTVRIWEYPLDREDSVAEQQVEDPVECVQVLSMGTRDAMTAALAYLPNTCHLALALAGTDSKIHLYIRSKHQKEVVPIDPLLCSPRQ